METLENDWIELRRKFIASASVGASTVRGQQLGAILGIRYALSSIDVSTLSRITSSEEFSGWLEEQTLFLTQQLQGRWGSCRKLLNIYVFALSRDYMLREHFGLEKMEGFFEVPLDGKMVAFLHEASEKSVKKQLIAKHRFRIRDLSPEVSAELQEAARLVAKRWRVPRVWLDLKAWAA